MGILSSWFSRFSRSNDIEQIADSLIGLFIKHVSVAQSSKQSAVDRAFSYVLAQAKGEIRRQNMSRAARARLANRFAWGLMERGFSREIALPMARKLAMELAKIQSRPSE